MFKWVVLSPGSWATVEEGWQRGSRKVTMQDANQVWLCLPTDLGTGFAHPRLTITAVTLLVCGLCAVRGWTPTSSSPSSVGGRGPLIGQADSISTICTPWRHSGWPSFRGLSGWKEEEEEEGISSAQLVSTHWRCLRHSDGVVIVIFVGVHWFVSLL